MKGTLNYKFISLNSNPCECDTIRIKNKTYTFTCEPTKKKDIQIGWTLQETGKNMIDKIPNLNGTYKETIVRTKRWFMKDKVEEFRNYTFTTEDNVSSGFTDVANKTY
jgi:hypothetical protein